MLSRDIFTVKHLLSQRYNMTHIYVVKVQRTSRHHSGENNALSILKVVSFVYTLHLIVVQYMFKTNSKPHIYWQNCVYERVRKWHIGMSCSSSSRNARVSTKYTARYRDENVNCSSAKRPHAIYTTSHHTTILCSTISLPFSSRLIYVSVRYYDGRHHLYCIAKRKWYYSWPSISISLILASTHFIYYIWTTYIYRFSYHSPTHTPCHPQTLFIILSSWIHHNVYVLFMRFTLLEKKWTSILCGTYIHERLWISIKYSCEWFSKSVQVLPISIHIL